MKAVANISAVQKFENWYVRPLRILELFKDGDGGFIAFGPALALYERLIRARLKSKGIKGTPESFRTEAANDLGIEERDFRIWWEIFR